MSRTAHAWIVFLFGSTLAVSAVAQHTPEAVSADRLWSALSAGNQRFATGTLKAHDLVARRQQLTTTQHPHVAVLSCADSRVPPEFVFDQGLGDLFVVRSAGENADPGSVGSLEYAVANLGTTMIIVMGHQSCGAVKAACSGGKAPSPNLEAVVTPIATSCSRVEKTKPDTFETAARDHVHSVAQELLAKSEMLKTAVRDGKLTIIEAYYSLDNGRVTKLR